MANFKPDFTKDDPWEGITEEYIAKEAAAYKPTPEQPLPPSMRTPEGLAAREAAKPEPEPPPEPELPPTGWKPDYTKPSPFEGMPQEYVEKEAAAYKPTEEQPLPPSQRTPEGIAAREAAPTVSEEIAAIKLAPGSTPDKPILSQEDYDTYQKLQDEQKFTKQVELGLIEEGSQFVPGFQITYAPGVPIEEQILKPREWTYIKPEEVARRADIDVALEKLAPYKVDGDYDLQAAFAAGRGEDVEVAGDLGIFTQRDIAIAKAGIVVVPAEVTPEDKAKFEEDLKSMPVDLQDAYKEGGFEGYTKASLAYTEATEALAERRARAMEALKPYQVTTTYEWEGQRMPESGYNISQFLIDNPDKEWMLKSAGYTDEHIQIAKGNITALSVEPPNIEDLFLAESDKYKKSVITASGAGTVPIQVLPGAPRWAGLLPPDVAYKALPSSWKQQILSFYAADEDKKVSITEYLSVATPPLNFYFPPIRATRPDVTIEDIKWWEWTIAGVNVVMLASPYWMPKVPPALSKIKSYVPGTAAHLERKIVMTSRQWADLQMQLARQNLTMRPVYVTNIAGKPYVYFQVRAMEELIFHAPIKYYKAVPLHPGGGGRPGLAVLEEVVTPVLPETVTREIASRTIAYPTAAPLLAPTPGGVPFIPPVPVILPAPSPAPVITPTVAPTITPLPAPPPAIVPAVAPPVAPSIAPIVSPTPAVFPTPSPTVTPVITPVPTPIVDVIPTPVTPVIPTPEPVPVPVPEPIPVPVPTPVPIPVPVPPPPVPPPTEIVPPTPPVRVLPIPWLELSSAEREKLLAEKGKVFWKERDRWLIIESPWTQKDVTVSPTPPPEATVLEGTPQETLKFTGKIPWKTMSIDYGDLDIVINVEGREIVETVKTVGAINIDSTGRGSLTDIGKRLPSTMKGISIPSTVGREATVEELKEVPKEEEKVPFLTWVESPGWMFGEDKPKEATESPPELPKVKKPSDKHLSLAEQMERGGRVVGPHLRPRRKKKKTPPYDPLARYYLGRKLPDSNLRIDL